MTSFSKKILKCVCSLLVLAVLFGGILTVLNTVLYVSPTERTNRAITKIYGELKDYDVFLDVDNPERDDKAQEIYNPTNPKEVIGTINKYYKIGTDLLFQTTGNNGYKGGSITLWIRVITNEQNRQIIDKIIYENNTKQTMMSKLDGSFYQNFYVDVTDNRQFFSSKEESSTTTNAVTSATFSAMAACNAVNCVIYYMGVI